MESNDKNTNSDSGGSTLTVLVVDDDQGILHAVERTLRSLPVNVLMADSPAKAIGILNETQIAVVLSDYMMPGMNGLEFLSLVRNRWPDTVGVMMTACDDIRVAADAVNKRLVFAFITKPWETKALRQSLMDAVEKYRNNLSQREGLEGSAAKSLSTEIQKRAFAAAFSLARAVDARDSYTRMHSEKVAAYSQVIGRALGLGEGELEELRIGGLLHDLGKIGISDGVLLKPGRLSKEEYDAVKKHPTIGASIVEPIEFSDNIKNIIIQHHENHDGTGYPGGLGGDEISQLARIVHVVDAYEAMSANRVYRDARESGWIVNEFIRCRGTQFDPYITDVFLGELNNGNIEAVLADLQKASGFNL